MKEWQKELPIAKESVRMPKKNIISLWRSDRFTIKAADYCAELCAQWDDTHWNGSNAFHLIKRVLLAGSHRESERVGWSDVPQRILTDVPPEFLKLEKWNGCHPEGPWYYIENTLYQASDRDCHGLRKGEQKLIRNGSTGAPCWELVAQVEPGILYPSERYAGAEVFPVADLVKVADGAQPPPIPSLDWRLKYRIGEGKERDFAAARRSAIWPEATDEELISDDLEQRLKDRLPALLSEFRADLERIGLTW